MKPRPDWVRVGRSSVEYNRLPWRREGEQWWGLGWNVYKLERERNSYWYFCKESTYKVRYSKGFSAIQRWTGRTVDWEWNQFCLVKENERNCLHILIAFVRRPQSTKKRSTEGSGLTPANAQSRMC